MAHDDLIEREDAVERVLALREDVFPDRSTESVPLDAIDGRVLAEPVVTERDIPSISTATMDGFAFDATDDYPLVLIDEEVFPEDEPPRIEPGEAVRIATGAPLPEGANAVLKREDATVEDDRLSGDAIEPGTYVYGKGSNVTSGETLFRPGERLAPRDAILLRDVGVERVSVRTRLSAGLLATGTEIHEGRSEDLDSPMLAGLVRAWGHEATFEGTAPDQYETVEARISSIADSHDVVITTGGTSVGKKDYVVRALAELGEVIFHGVLVRPGKPIAVANLPDHDAVAFAIPGKPVGAHTIATAVARPFFTGETTLPAVEARLARDVGIGREGFEYWVPVSLDRIVEGTDPTPRYEAMPLGHVDSPLSVYNDVFNPSVLSQSTRATRADGFFVIEEGAEAGETVRVVPYDALL